MFFTQSQFTSRHQRGSMSENMITDGEEDHYLEEFFPKQVPYHLLPLIEHRIKLLCKTDATINLGEVQLINMYNQGEISQKTIHVSAPL